jgi:hypothetical protein
MRNGGGSGQDNRAWQGCRLPSPFMTNVIKLQLKPCRLCNLVQLERRQRDIARKRRPMNLAITGTLKKGIHRAIQ